MTAQSHQNINFSLAFYSSNRKTGQISIVTRQNGNTDVKSLDVIAQTALEAHLKPILIGVTEDRQSVLLDPQTKTISYLKGFPEDAFAAHIYTDSASDRSWFMNDGDKATGNDTINCGSDGSSVSIVNDVDSTNASYVSTVCVGRGHHQAAFSYPSAAYPDTPKQAYISNLKDGTLSVIGNDPDEDGYLKRLFTIDLCEPEKEENPVPSIPNNAFPHGLTFSGVSGMLYNLNNGYGTIAVINPITFDIEDRLPFKGHSNLFLAPGERFVIGRGADRKTDAEHVIAKLSVLDVEDHEVKNSIDLQDVYISKYFFNPEGTRLYLTTSSSGNDVQKNNLKTDAIMVFDITALPELKLINEVRLGSSSGTLDFQTENGKSQLMFSSNAADGEVVIMNPDTGKILERLKVAEKNSHSRVWTLK